MISLCNHSRVSPIFLCILLQLLIKSLDMQFIVRMNDMFDALNCSILAQVH